MRSSYDKADMDLVAGSPSARFIGACMNACMDEHMHAHRHTRAEFVGFTLCSE